MLPLSKKTLATHVLGTNDNILRYSTSDKHHFSSVSLGLKLAREGWQPEDHIYQSGHPGHSVSQFDLVIPHHGVFVCSLLTERNQPQLVICI